jgi:hydrogenase maturation protease
MNASSHNARTLLIGIGNDGRGDDAMGWLFADRFAGDTSLDVAWRYQLQIEDAELIRHYDTVIFVDASMAEVESGYSYEPCQPVAAVHFSTHKVDPGTVLWLAREMYQAETAGYVLAIQGYHWDLGEGLSEWATQNFNQATEYFTSDVLRQTSDV